MDSWKQKSVKYCFRVYRATEPTLDNLIHREKFIGMYQLMRLWRPSSTNYHSWVEVVQFQSMTLDMTTGGQRYDSQQESEHLRAWSLTIAKNQWPSSNSTHRFIFLSFLFGPDLQCNGRLPPILMKAPFLYSAYWFKCSFLPAIWASLNLVKLTSKINNQRHDLLYRSVRSLMGIDKYSKRSLKRALTSSPKIEPLRQLGMIGVFWAESPDHSLCVVVSIIRDLLWSVEAMNLRKSKRRYMEGLEEEREGGDDVIMF